MFVSVPKQSLADAVFTQLRDRILDGDLQPGDPLPAERLLAEQLGVNRSAVREALKRAEQAGLVAIHHGGSTRVLDVGRSASPDLLIPMAERSPARQAQVRALRDALLPEIARAAAERATADQIARLEMLSGLLEAAAPDAQAGLAAELWEGVVDASHNVAFRLIHGITAQVVPSPGAPADLADLVNALAAGDTRGAAMAVQELLG